MAQLNAKSIIATFILSVATLFVCSTSFARVVKIDSIQDIRNKSYNNFSDTFHVHPDVGSELQKISSELKTANKLATFLKDKKAIGKKLDVETGTFYFTFQYDKNAENMSWQTKLGNIIHINSKLTDLLEKNILLNEGL